MKKYQWDKKVILKVVISLVVFLVAWQCFNWIDLAYGDRLETEDTWRFAQQFCGLVMGASAIYVIFFQLKKLIPVQLKKDILHGVAWVFNKIGAGIHTAVYAVRHALGIPDPPKRTKARDERSFVFDMEENDLVRRFRNLGGGLKWKDLQDNADKIRFIYIKYINRFMKKGYKFSTILTPMETLEKWKLQDHESAFMFPLYTDARYSGGRRLITDEEVERSSKYMKVKSKNDDI